MIPTVGQIVQETIALKRALACSHEWQTHTATEDRCDNCGVCATPQGKAHLAKLALRGSR